MRQVPRCSAFSCRHRPGPRRSIHGACRRLVSRYRRTWTGPPPAARTFIGHTGDAAQDGKRGCAQLVLLHARVRLYRYVVLRGNWDGWWACQSEGTEERLNTCIVTGKHESKKFIVATVFVCSVWRNENDGRTVSLSVKQRERVG